MSVTEPAEEGQTYNFNEWLSKLNESDRRRDHAETALRVLQLRHAELCTRVHAVLYSMTSGQPYHDPVKALRAALALAEAGDL